MRDDRDDLRRAVVIVLRRCLAAAGIDPARVRVRDCDVAGWPSRTFATPLGAAWGSAGRRGDGYVIQLAAGLDGDDLVATALHELYHVAAHVNAGEPSALDRRIAELEAEMFVIEHLPAFRRAVEIELRKQRRLHVWLN